MRAQQTTTTVQRRPGGDIDPVPLPGHHPLPTIPDPTAPPTLRDGSVVGQTGSAQRYVFRGGALHAIPNVQTFRLGGYAGQRLVQMSAKELAAVPAGAAVPEFPWAVASAEYWSPGRGHHITAHVSLNLKTGQLTGTATTTNYVQLTGFHSGVLVIPCNEAGDPVRPGLPGTFRFGVDWRHYGSPVTRTDAIPTPGTTFNIGPDTAAEVCALRLIVAEDPNSLEQSLRQLGGLVKDAYQVATAIAGFGSLTSGAGSTKP